MNRYVATSALFSHCRAFFARPRRARPALVLGIHAVTLVVGWQLLRADSALAGTIRVPGDFPTIQEAIEQAANGDTVLVAPGTYQESIDFLGKAIEVRSVSGPALTVIVGPVEPGGPGVCGLGNPGSVVYFTAGEGRDSVLEGFTITGGDGQFFAGGIYVCESSPSILKNIITGNMACGCSPGIYVYGSASAPLIRGNEISNNHPRPGCSGGIGGGIAVVGGGPGEIIANRIFANSCPFGGGIVLWGARATVRSNFITGNTSVDGGGGGLYVTNSSESLVADNVIFDNNGPNGSEVHLWSHVSEVPTLMNNTIVGTGASSAVVVTHLVAQALIANNIVVGAPGQFALECTSMVPDLVHNNVYSPTGTPYSPGCGVPTGMSGNISADPMLVDPAAGDFHIADKSPSVEAGAPNLGTLSPMDLDGEPRIMDSDGDGVAVIDQGVDEVRDRTLLFVDGFESGNLNSWSIVVGAG